MKIIVAIKQVPARDSQLRIGPTGQWIEEADLSLRDQRAGRLRAGRSAAAEGKARRRSGRPVRRSGARRANHPRSAGQRRRPRHPHRRGKSRARSIRWLARLLAAAAEAEKPDLVLTGLQSDDLGYGQTGVILAELLGLPHATIIMQVEVRTARIRVKRELEDGWFQHVEMPLPAVLTIQSGINKLRYATLMGIKKAKTKEIRRVTAAELGRGAGRASAVLERVYLPRAQPSRRRCSKATPKQAAAQLVEKLKIRGAGHMSGFWWSWNSTAGAVEHACRGRRWPPASNSRGSSGSRRGRGAGARHRRPGEGTGRHRSSSKVYAVEHELLEELHAGRLHRGAGTAHRRRTAARRAVPAHLPGARLSPRSWRRALGTAADQRRRSRFASSRRR